MLEFIVIWILELWLYIFLKKSQSSEVLPRLSQKSKIESLGTRFNGF